MCECAHIARRSRKTRSRFHDTTANGSSDTTFFGELNMLQAGRNEVRWRPVQELIWQSHVRTRGRLEANVMHRRKCL